MKARFQIIAFVVIVVGATLLLIAPGTSQGDARAIAPGVTLRVQGVGVTGKHEPWRVSADALQRAHALADGRPLIGTDSLPGGYAPTYLGFVGYVWQLPHTPELENPAEWALALRSRYSAEIPHAMLQPGDLIANLRTGTFGHAIVFARWNRVGQWMNDQAQQRGAFEAGVEFVGYELDRVASPTYVAERVYTLGYIEGALTVKELEPLWHGPYAALRYNGVPGYVSLVKGVRVTSQSVVGERVPASFVLVNRGGTPVRLSRIAVVAYGPGALEQGLAGTPRLYAQVNDVVLAPGQVYTYNQAIVFHQAGTFVALPRFEVDGVLSLPLTPAYFEVRAG